MPPYSLEEYPITVLKMAYRPHNPSYLPRVSQIKFPLNNSVQFLRIFHNASSKWRVLCRGDFSDSYGEKELALYRVLTRPLCELSGSITDVLRV